MNKLSDTVTYFDSHQFCSYLKQSYVFGFILSLGRWRYALKISVRFLGRQRNFCIRILNQLSMQPNSVLYTIAFGFFLTALLRYSSYTVQLTHLKCPFQWFLVYLASCAAFSTTNFRTILLPQKESLYL